MDLIFEEPPKRERTGGMVAGRTPLGLWLVALREHPGQWAKWTELVYDATSTRIRRGEGWGTKPGEYETRTVVVEGEKRKTLYARYIGDTGAVEGES